MYIYGKNVAREKLNTNEKIVRAYLAKNFRDQDIIAKLKERHIKIQFQDSYVLDKKVNGHSQGILLEVEDFKTYTLEEFFSKNLSKKEGLPLLVMLDHLEDPHNFGAIIRTSEALGVDGIIIPADRSVDVTSTVIKTSAGAISYLPIVKVPNLTSTIRKLKEIGFWIVGTDMNGEDYTTLDYQVPICLVIGNEGHGMSQIVRKNCDFIASIPMSGHINSLNASVSCAIVLSEICRKRIGS